MNKKGFTLIEIIVVIGLIALVAIIVGTNMVGLNVKQKEKDYEKLVLSFEEAANTYVGLNSGGIKDRLMNGIAQTITLNDLIRTGLLNDDNIDPRTNETFKTSYKIEISYVGSTGVFNYCYVEEGTRNSNKSNWDCTKKEWIDKK